MSARVCDSFTRAVFTNVHNTWLYINFYSRYEHARWRQVFSHNPRTSQLQQNAARTQTLKYIHTHLITALSGGKFSAGRRVAYKSIRVFLIKGLDRVASFYWHPDIKREKYRCRKEEWNAPREREARGEPGILKLENPISSEVLLHVYWCVKSFSGCRHSLVLNVCLVECWFDPHWYISNAIRWEQFHTFNKAVVRCELHIDKNTDHV